MKEKKCNALVHLVGPLDEDDINGFNETSFDALATSYEFIETEYQLYPNWPIMVVSDINLPMNKLRLHVKDLVGAWDAREGDLFLNWKKWDRYGFRDPREG